MKCTKTFLSILLTTLSFSLQGQDFEQLILGAWQEEKVTSVLICEGRIYNGIIPEISFDGLGFIYFFRENGLLELDSRISDELSSGTYRIEDRQLSRSVDGLEFQDTIQQINSQWLVTESRVTGGPFSAQEMGDLRQMRKERTITAKGMRLVKRLVGKEITISYTTYFRRVDTPEENR